MCETRTTGGATATATTIAILATTRVTGSARARIAMTTTVEREATSPRGSAGTSAKSTPSATGTTATRRSAATSTGTRSRTRRRRHEGTRGEGAANETVHWTRVRILRPRRFPCPHFQCRVALLCALPTTSSEPRSFACGSWRKRASTRTSCRPKRLGHSSSSLRARGIVGACPQSTTKASPKHRLPQPRARATNGPSPPSSRTMIACASRARRTTWTRTRTATTRA
mmetsp:Transcript_13683/g.36635  ORF Transcript_13683/g.36635 Transcript_13683/m.36635 type:complete len:227 (+) Transcript_13683:62-742(+)